MRPLDLFKDGELKLTMLLASNQAIERSLRAILLPYAPCAMQYSEFHPGNAETSPEFTVQDELEFQFSFRPVTLQNIFGLDCENLWSIDSVQILGIAGRLSNVFEVFENEVTAWRENDLD